MATGETDTNRVFRWFFNDKRAMVRALEQYLDFLDSTVTTHYGLPTGDGRDPDVEMHAACRRSEIDACMDILAERGPLLWRVLDVYFRRGGHTEPMGWTVVASCVGLRRAICPCPTGVRCVVPVSPKVDKEQAGLPACPEAKRLGCSEDREALRTLVGIATRKLYAIHRQRASTR